MRYWRIDKNKKNIKSLTVISLNEEIGDEVGWTCELARA